MHNNVPYIGPETNVVPRFTPLPRSLLVHAPQLDLSIEAVLAYALMWDRAMLSAANGWVDTNHNVYIHYPRSTMCDHLNLTKGTVQDIYKQLVKARLITEIPVEHYGIPQIYVNRWVDPDEDAPFDDIVKQLRPIKPYTAHLRTGSFLRCPHPVCCNSDYLSLRPRSRLLYVLLLDRLNSAIHQGLCDSRGNYICHIDADRAMSLLQCRSSALTRAYAQLSEYGYIYKDKTSFAGKEYCRLRPCWSDSPLPIA